MNLDERILKNLTCENLKEVYEKFKEKKHDYLSIPEKDKRQMGEDGISLRTYDKIFTDSNNFLAIINRVKNRKYLFKPFREIEISKDKRLSLKEAKLKNKIRVLSIANVKDTVVQQVIYESIKEYTEKKFKEIDLVSYAYREGKSAPSAVRRIQKYIELDYKYVLNMDLSKFFDTINHKLMINDLYKFFGKDNKILLTILKNFLYSYRITSKNLKETKYKGKKLRPTLKIFHNVKVKRERREKGIPQGGVLSGLLANIYLYDFDLWISNILRRKYDLKYIRYADDFLILLKNDEKIEEIFKEVESQLSKKELKVHPLGEKSEVINLNERSTNYVGFEIKKNKVKVKKNNEIAFKNKIKLILNEAEKLQEFEEKKSIKVLNNIIRKINFKIIGNRAFYEKYEKCGKEPDYKNWIGYFGNITDVHQLKKIDRWIFNNLKFFMYKNFGFKIKKSNYSYLKANNFEQNLYKLRRLELEYYGYRKSLRKKIEFCKCTPKEKSEFEQY